MAQPRSQKLSGLLLIILAAGCGYLMITVPPAVIQNYDKAARHGVWWAYLYLATVTLGVVAMGAVCAVVAYRLWRATGRRRVKAARLTKSPSQMTRGEKLAAVSSNLQEATSLAADLAAAGQDSGAIDTAIAEIQHKRDSQVLEIVAFGTVSSGKSSLLNALAGRDMFRTHAGGGTTTCRNDIPWPGDDRVVLVDTPGLDEIDGHQHEAIARQAAGQADIVLMVLDGPVRDSEMALLKLLAQMEKRVLVCLNKGDWYDPQQRQELWTQVVEQVGSYVDKDDVVVVQSKPTARSRVTVRSDGSEQRHTDYTHPDITPLARRMLATISRDGSDVLLANLLLRSRAVVDDAVQQVRAALDQRAVRIVNQYMWRAGALSAVIPFPAVDVAAGMTISTKMVFDLARVYRQPIDLRAAERLLGQMGKNLVGILGSHAISPALGAMIASAMKTVPGVGTISGGVLQGLTQAMVTRWIGHVFIEYFRSEMQVSGGGLAELARKKWDQLTQQAELVELAKAGLAAWRRDTAPDDQATRREDLPS